MTQTVNPYTTTLRLSKGTRIPEFIADSPTNVSFDPVANNIFIPLSKHEEGIQEDFELKLLRLPIAEFDLGQDVDDIFCDLDRKGLAQVHHYFAVLLWYQDPEILQPGEGAVILGPVLEQAMMGHHMFSIGRTAKQRRCDYAPIGDNKVHPRYPVQWCIVAKK